MCTYTHQYTRTYILVQLFWSNSYIRDSKTDIVTIDLTTPNSIKTIQQLKCLHPSVSGSLCRISANRREHLQKPARLFTVMKSTVMNQKMTPVFRDVSLEASGTQACTQRSKTAEMTPQKSNLPSEPKRLNATLHPAPPSSFAPHISIAYPSLLCHTPWMHHLFPLTSPPS